MGGTEVLVQQIQNWLADFGWRAIAVLIILLVGLGGARVLQTLVQQVMQRKGIDSTLVSLSSYVFYFIALVLAVTVALGQVPGTEMMVQQLQNWLADFGWRAIAALVILLVGLRSARLLQNLVERAMHRSGIESTLVSFSGHVFYFATLVIAAITALQQMNVNTASFVAILGSAGLAIGLALQNSLSNFAAGVLIIVFRPFRMGDYIEGAGVSGFVEEIQMLTTTLKTSDNRTIFVPNRKLFEDNITNYSTKPQRRIDLVVSIPAPGRMDDNRQLLLEVLRQDSRVLKEPPPQVRVLESTETAIKFVIRPWIHTRDYWDVYFDLQEAMQRRFEAEGLIVPLQPQDVYVYRYGDRR
jgi:small conductance mechanosensitive channel